VKRKVAIAFFAFVLLVVGGSVLFLRSDLAGEKLCRLAEARVRSATGMALSLASCHVDPLTLEISTQGVVLGPPEAPLFTAEAVVVRLEPVQALGQRLQIRRLSAVRPQIHVVLPPPRPDAAPAVCPPPILSQFELHHLDVEAGALDLRLPGGERVSVSRVDVHSAPSTIRHTLRALTTAAFRTHVAVELGPSTVEAQGRTTQVSRAGAEVDLALDLSELRVDQVGVELDGVKLGATGAISNLCAPVLDLNLSVNAPMARLLKLAGSSRVGEGEASLQVQVTGPLRAPDVRGALRLSHARLGPYRPGDATIGFRLAGTDLTFERIDVPFQGGQVLGKGKLQLGRGLALSADLELRQVELAEVFTRLGLDGAWVMLRVGGQVHVAGKLSPFELTGQADLDLQDFRVFSHSWLLYHPGEPTIVDFKRARVEAPVRIDAEGVGLEGAKVKSGQGSLGVTGKLYFQDTRGFQLALAGSIDLSELRHVASVPFAGLADLTGSVVSASYGEPRIEARFRASNFRLLRLDLGEVATAALFDRRVLGFKDIQGQKGVTRYQGSAQLEFHPGGVRLSETHLAASGRMRDLFEAAMPWQPNARFIRDLIEARAEVEATASGELPGFDAHFEAQLGAGALAGRSFQSGRVEGQITKGERVDFEHAELRRGGGRVQASGLLPFDPAAPCDVRVAFSGLPLAELDLPAGPWSGTASGTAGIGGSMAQPAIHFAVSGDGVSLLGIPVGAAQVSGDLSQGRVTATGNTEGVDFTASIRTSEGYPFEAKARIDVADVTRFIPGGPPAGLRAEVKGEATAEGRLAELERARARLRLTRIHGGYGDFKVDAAGPVVIAVDRGRIELEGLTLKGANTEFTLSGARAADGRLDLNAAGKLDLRLLGGVLPELGAPHGQLSVEGHVGGTAADPVLVGVGRLSEAGFRIADLPIVYNRLRGDLAFSQNRVLFDDLSATLNGGPTQLRGEVELSRFRPVRLRIESSAEEVAWTIPEWLPATITGQLTASGSLDALSLTGRVHVVRGQYTERVDLDKSIVEFWRRRAAVARAYDKSGEWLRFEVGILVDGDARIDNDLAHGGLKGELTLTGSLAAPGLVGSLAMTPGGRGMYRGNEFTLTHAVLDFADRHRFAPTFDVHGETVVRDYQVFLHAYGTLEQTEIQLTSSPALTREDIATLLSLGITTRDSTVQGGLAGLGGAATAAAAQALFSVSGLDDQVKRFLPRDGILRDFSVRMTTAYSETSGQVEPRAEFESRALGDRLRLRYQAPLSGARGQRAQAELRLGEHSAVQYQWDNDNPDAPSIGDHGVDLKLRWEWND